MVICTTEQWKFHNIVVTDSCFEVLYAVILAGCNYNSSV